MHDKIHAAPGCPERVEYRLDGIGALDVAGIEHRRAERSGEGLYPPPEMLALVGESEFRALACQGPGDAPGDRMIVGNPHDQAALAGHQLAHASVLSRRSAETPAWRLCRRIRRNWIARRSDLRRPGVREQSAYPRTPDRAPRYSRSRR